MASYDKQPFTNEEIETLRVLTKEKLEALETEIVALEGSTTSIPLWIDTNSTRTTTTTTTTTTNTNGKQQQSYNCRYFNTYGFLKIENFSDANEVQELKKQMEEIVDQQWDPTMDTNETFGTDDEANLSRGDYFLESATRVHFFEEPDTAKHLGTTSQKLNLLNKVGHAMHTQTDTIFYNYATSDKIVNLLLNDIGYQDPVVPQSMYICKNSKIGSSVHAHQDSTFLYTEPKQSCLGLWLALDEATLTNGCLWVRPKSHYETLRRQYKRNPNYFGRKGIECKSNVPMLQPDEQQQQQKKNKENSEETAVPHFIMEEKEEATKVPWEGGLPGIDCSSTNPQSTAAAAAAESIPSYQPLLDAGFVPIECKAGDLLVFTGLTDHLSLPNFSDLPRHTFQLHLIEGENVGVYWSKSNWLQYPPPEEGNRNSRHEFLSLLAETNRPRPKPTL